MIVISSREHLIEPATVQCDVSILYVDMSNVQLTAINRTDDKVRSTDELVFESSQSGNTFHSTGDQQEYTVPGQPDEQEHQYSVIGTELSRQGSTRKEAQNYLYGKFQPTETARHPTVTQQHSSQSVESVESIAKTKTCGCTTGQFCMYFFICIILLLSIAGITIAVLAWQGVGTDDCSCNGEYTIIHTGILLCDILTGKASTH